MIWLFDRGREDLRVETQFDNVAGEYVLTLRHPDGSHSVERYSTRPASEARLSGLEHGLADGSWQPRVPTTLHMKDSWQL